MDSGWSVVKSLEDYPGRTGGCFSCSYIVQKGGRNAFLKALDYSQATELSRQLGLDIPAALQMLIGAYNFERTLLRQCAEKRMDRVITALEDGSVRVDDGVFGVVNYLIFESADSDVRRYLSAAQGIEVTWKLRCLHHIATGLCQLHTAGVAHQDLKPSNVLVFDGHVSKVADLGCASVKGATSPRDDFGFAGDGTYAPPELLYGHFDTEWTRRRQACDVYHLGSMAVFLFCGIGTTAMIFKNLAQEHLPQHWKGTYSQILPEVRDAFGTAVGEFGLSVAEDKLRKPLRDAVTQLCDPDPQFRGHPLNRMGATSRYSLERYVSLFNLLAEKARLGVFWN